MQDLEDCPLDDSFDVFLSHNSKDKPAVRRLAKALRERGLTVWLDEWELIPGRRWIPALEKAIETGRSAAICVGASGLGPWERPEMEGAISEFVDRDLPVIPVLLPQAPEKPRLPLFLRGFTWVDLREGLTQDGINCLVWGITGKRPEVEEEPPRPTAPRLHNLPFLPLGDLFKGREEELAHLASLPAGASAITQTIHGLGGIGKTRLAVEYAWRSGDRYTAAFFVVADSRASLRSGLAGLAQAQLLNLPERAAPAEDEVVGCLLRHLRENPGWLLILDNVDSDEASAAAQEILPFLTEGHVLITSRRREWPPNIKRYPLDEMELEDAMAFLLARTEADRTKAPNDATQARLLAEKLDGLPLALEQAGAFIAHHQMSFAHYLGSWEKERLEVLSWYDPVMQYPVSVAVTWQRTFNAVSPTGRAILRLAAFLAPEPIPQRMFEEGTSILEEAVGLLCEETGEKSSLVVVQKALAELAKYSLIEREAEVSSVHRVVQEVLRARIPEERSKAWVERSLQLVDGFAQGRPDDVRTWGVWEPLRPHVAAVVGRGESFGVTEPTARLMGELGLFLRTKGVYGEAEPLMRRALAIDEASYGHDHPRVAIRLSNLALLLQDTNRMDEAEPLMRRALAIGEASYGPDHPTVALRLNNLAQLLQATNRLGEAEPLMRRALAIGEASYGPDHPTVAIRLSNLAQLLKATNRLVEAEPLMRRALAIGEASYGPDHPTVAIGLNNLGRLLQATNRLGEAEPMMRRALAIDEASYGPDHPDVAIDLTNLAQLLQETNRLGEAEPLMRRALAIGEASYGPDHPHTLFLRKNLEILLAELGDDA